MKSNRYFLSFVWVITTAFVFSQAKFTLHNVVLPPGLSAWQHQFSGLCVFNNRLFLLSESRAQYKAGAWHSDEATLYSLQLSDLDKNIADSTHKLKETKLPIEGLEEAKEKMRASGNIYEGLEAFFIENDTVYFAVETSPASPDCYLLRGKLGTQAIQLDGSLVPLPKPKKQDGAFVHNAGFEALVKTGSSLLAFYECNSFSPKNEVCRVGCSCFSQPQPLTYLAVDKIPFRLTDITATGKTKFTAINYYYEGERESIYTPLPDDALNYNLIKTEKGFRSYSRLVELRLSATDLTWSPLWEFPSDYWGYNWEGLAAYKNGYFVINDTYAPKGKQTVLVYLEPAN